MGDGTGGPLRVVVADDSVLLREGLQLILADAGHTVVATAGDGPGLVAAVAEHAPDLALVDVRMPPSHTDEGLRPRSRSAARGRGRGSWC